MSTTQTGSTGERIATRFCISQGMRIIARNWRFGKGEIDIISLDDGILVFCEVKYRKTLAFGYPEESITPKKQRMLAQTIRAYLQKNPTSRFRVDCISILSIGGKTKLRHMRDIEIMP